MDHQRVFYDCQGIFSSLQSDGLCLDEWNLFCLKTLCYRKKYHNNFLPEASQHKKGHDFSLLDLFYFHDYFNFNYRYYRWIIYQQHPPQGSFSLIKNHQSIVIIKIIIITTSQHIHITFIITFSILNLTTSKTKILKGCQKLL